MATITAEAKLYNGTRLLLVDKTITANLQSVFSLGNFNRPIQPNDEFALSANVLGFKLLRTAAGSEAIASLSLTDQRLATFGGGNKIGVVNPAQPWIVTSTLRCKFPTYVRFDLEALGVPQGTNIIIELEEGFVIEGDYPGSERKALSKVLNLMAFRTPKKFASYPVGQFALPGNFNYRIRGVASSIGALFTPAVAAQANKAGVIELESFVTTFITANFTGIFGSQMSSAASQVSVIGYLQDISVSLAQMLFATNTVNVRVRFFSSTTAAMAALTDINGNRIRFGISNNTLTSTVLTTTLLSRRRNTASVISCSAQASISGGRRRPFSAVIASGTSMTTTAEKFGQVYELINPNSFGTREQDQFGNSVTVTDSLIAVAAHQEDDQFHTDQGNVYIFSRATGLLERTLSGATFNNHGSPSQDRFGSSVAMKGNRLAVGARFDGAGTSSIGRVHLIEPFIPALTATRSHTHPPGTTGSVDQFGQQVAIDEYLVVASRGAVNVFNTGQGTLQLAVPNVTAADTQIGNKSVATKGQNFAVGHHENNQKVEIWSMITQSRLYRITGTGQFGKAVAINSTHFVVTDHQAIVNGLTVGQAYLYTISNGQLVATLNLPVPSPGNSPEFGACVAMNETHIAVGSPTHSSNNGAVTIFRMNGTLFRHIPGLGQFGCSVAMTATDLIIGAQFRPFGVDSASGRASLFSFNKA